MDNYIKLNYKDRQFFINKDDSLKTLLTYGELLKLPLSSWKELFELKDGKCYIGLLNTVLEEVIKAYDKSSKVNSFIYKEKEYWLDKDTRVGLKNLANCSSDKMSLVLGDEIIEMSVEDVKKFLANLEVYAGKCYVNTAKHLLAIKELKTIEDVVNYDYTSGYPDRITLNE